MVSISVCMIAKNEERCIERCIRSFLPLANEVIVVDTGSSDSTAAIAESLGAKVCHFAWINDFSAAKNFALSKASGDWIVFPDADDYLPGENAGTLRAAIEARHGDKNTHAFSHTVRNFLGAGTEGSPYIDTQYCKVFRNDRNIRYQRPLHEYIGWLGESPPPFKMLKAAPDTFVFYHDGYRDDLIAKKDARDIVFIDGLPRSILPATARFYRYLGRKDEARAVFGRYFRSGEKDDKHTIEPHIVCVELLFELKAKYSELQYVLDCALKAFPEHPGARLLAGYALCRVHRYPEAIARFREGFGLLESARGVYGPVALMESSHSRFWGMLAEMFGLKGEQANALSSAERALSLDPLHQGALAVIARREPKESLAFISGRYDLSSRDVLQSLIPPFAANRPGEAFLYLFERYFNITGQKDINFITMLAVAGEYSGAVNALLARYEASGFEPYLAKALAFAVLSGLEAPVLAVAKSAKGALLPREFARESRENTVLHNKNRGALYARLAEMALGRNIRPESGDLSAFATYR